ncbi:MAG: enoyl-CoA hydratase/isomerase family protein [Ignavibacteria bacterium]|jgi:enoyl-CoA hydratase/carnithine racemase
MAYSKFSEYEDEEIKCYMSNNIAVIKNKKNVYEVGTNLIQSSNLFEIVNSAERDKTVYALLLINEKDCLNNDNYSRFIRKVFLLDDDSHLTKAKLQDDKLRAKQITIMNNFIKKVVQFDKLIFSALNGEIVTPFFGASLAADFRFASDITVFSLAHLQMGLHPSGALPYFLPKYVGHAKASEILYKGENINARQALEMGIINEILPVADYENHCIEKAVHFFEKNINAITPTKKLINFSYNDLYEYLSIEEAEYYEK